MAIEHILFLRLRPLSALEHTTLLSTFLSLRSQIPGILDLSLGPNMSPVRAQGYTYALRVLFESEHALHVYSGHEAHEMFKSVLAPLYAAAGEEPKLVCVDWLV